MFKLIKYEFRKNMSGMGVMAGIMAAAQLYFMYAAFIANDRDKASMGALFLLVGAMVCFFMVFVLGIATYSRELSNKTSYLVFMTPNSAIKIIGSKLLYIFFNGAIVLAVIGLLGMADWTILARMWNEELSLLQLIISMLPVAGVDTLQILYTLLAIVIQFLVSFFMAVTLAYMSITATATILQNRKGKGIISVVLYVLMIVGINKLGGLLPRLYDSPRNMSQVILSGLPATMFFLLIIIGAVTATAGLLEKHVSL